MLEKFDKQYLRIAQIWSENSYAKRLKVRIRDKHYRVTGIKKRDLLEYFDSVPDQDQQKDTSVPSD